MATKVNYSDLSAPNYKTTIRIGTSKTTILFGDYGSCYGEYDETIAVNNSMNPVSTVDSTELIINYFSYHSPTTNGIVLAGKKFISDTPAGYIKFTSHGKTMIINVTIIGEAVEKNIEFNDSLNNYTVPVEDSNNCSLKLYYIYYEGKDSSGNWKKVTPTSNVLTTINLNFKGIGTATYTEDNYANQYVYWKNIPQQYIHPNNLPATATSTISIVDDTGATISDNREITFVAKYVMNLEETDYIVAYPNKKQSISFEIIDNDGNYCDANNISTFSATLDNTRFAKSDCQFSRYTNKNTIKVTTSDQIGDFTKLKISIGDIINKSITIINEVIYITFNLCVKINTIFKAIQSSNLPVGYIFAIYGGSDIYESWRGDIYHTGLATEINIGYTTTINERRKLSGYVRITLICASGLYTTKSNICMYGDTTGYVSLEQHCIAGTKYNNELYYFNAWLPDVELSWEKDITSTNDKSYDIDLDIVIN